MELTVRRTYHSVEVKVDELETTIFREDEAALLINNLLDAAYELTTLTGKPLSEYLNELGL